MASKTVHSGRERLCEKATALQRVDWSFPESNGTETIHSIHPYPARFIPEIPRSLIRLLPPQKGAIVFDPFCGCGTTLVEAQAAGWPSFGVDLNPIACMLTRVKTSPLPHDFVRAAHNCVRQAKADVDPVIPNIPNLEHWFSPEVRESIASLVNSIRKVEDDALREHLNVALSSILVRVSNQESDTRYAAIHKKVKGIQVFEQFSLACSRIAAHKEQLPFACRPADVMERDILAVRREDIRNRVGLVVTSPPYPNAYEYWLYHKYRMYWLGLDPLSVKEKEIGARAHYFRKNPPTVEDFRIQMKHVMHLLFTLLVPGGHVCFIVGRSRIHGRDIDNAKIISEVGNEVGLELGFRATRCIAQTRKSFNLSHARIRTEDLLVFQKAG